MVEVAIERCASYSTEEVGSSVRRVLDAVLAERVRVLGGRRVLVKPNLLAAREPARGVTTHPAVVGAVIDYLRGYGADVIVGDSPAGALRGVRRVWEKTGMLDLCASKSVPLVNFEAGGWMTHSVGGRAYQISRVVKEVDYIVNLAKFKTHVLTLLTGAIKNSYGFLPGAQKAKLHKAAGNPERFHQVVVDVFELRPPDLFIVDAVVGMEGNGPASPDLRDIGLILADQLHHLPGGITGVGFVDHLHTSDVKTLLNGDPPDHVSITNQDHFSQACFFRIEAGQQDLCLMTGRDSHGLGTFGPGGIQKLCERSYRHVTPPIRAVRPVPSATSSAPCARRWKAPACRWRARRWSTGLRAWCRSTRARRAG